MITVTFKIGNVVAAEYDYADEQAAWDCRDRLHVAMQTVGGDYQVTMRGLPEVAYATDGDAMDPDELVKLADGPCPGCGGSTSLGMCNNEACELFVPW